MSLLKSSTLSQSLLLKSNSDRAAQIEPASPGDNLAFDLIGLTQLRNDPQFAGIDGSGFSIAIIDTGIDKEHPLLASKYVAGYDFIDNDDDPTDTQGHGTHVSGTIGATDSKIGIATDVGLISLRTLDNNGSGFLTDVEDSLEWILANQERYNITAVNLSLGIGYYTPESGLSGDILSDDIRRLEAAGVTIISATGNDYFSNSGKSNQANLAFPAISSSIAVGAVWQDGAEANATWQSGSTDYTTGKDRIVSFSQRLNAPNVLFAPGAIITSTVPGGGLGTNAGTSQASPHVAGVIALMQEASQQFGGRSLTPNEVMEILRSTGDSIIDGDDEDDNIVNTGESYIRINAYNAVVEVKKRADNIAALSENNSDNIISGDSNGTIAGAVIAPAIDASKANTVKGSIGKDGTNIRNNDVDIYSFQLTSSGTVGLEVTTDINNPDDFDSYLRLFDSLGTEIAINDDIAEDNAFSRLDVNLEPGKYYVGISGYENINYDPNVADSGVAADTGNYNLQFSLSNQDPDGLVSGAKEVNLGNDLEPLLFAGNIGADKNKLVGVADVDLFRIVAPDNGVLFIDVDTPYQSDYVDSFLRIFDKNGNELIFAGNQQAAENDDSLAFDLDGQGIEFIAPNSSEIVLNNQEETNLRNGSTSPNGEYVKGNYGHNTDSFIAARVDRGEVYYVGVSDFSNHSYNATNLSNRSSNGLGGDYELIASFVNDDINGSIAQVKESTSLPIYQSYRSYWSRWRHRSRRSRCRLL